MDIDNAFANPTAENEGVWIDYRDGSKVKIARIGSLAFTKAYDAALKPHRRRQRAGTMDTVTETRILCEVVSRTILLGWEGFTQLGKEWKYSQKRAFDLLWGSLDFRNEVVELATAEETFHQDVQEDSEKNS
jgi:hypothetical protein